MIILIQSEFYNKKKSKKKNKSKAKNRGKIVTTFFLVKENSI